MCTITFFIVESQHDTISILHEGDEGEAEDDKGEEVEEGEEAEIMEEEDSEINSYDNNRICHKF